MQEKLLPRTENQIGNYVSGDFCQYWNLNSQITLDFDILIMVSKAEFKKKLNGQTRFTLEGPNFVHLLNFIMWQKNMINNQ